jgi:phosphomannomutase
MSLMISVSGIRGIFGTDLTPQNIVQFSAAYGTWLGGGKVVLGRDTRVTGPLCEDLITATLQSTGCDVIKVGVVPTPTVAMAVLEHNAAGGIIISASHNPKEWNALKLLNNKSEFLDSGQGQEVIQRSKEGDFAYQPYDQTGQVSTDSEALDHHINKIIGLPYIEPQKIADADFSVALDSVNGTGAPAVPKLLKKLGVKTVYQLNEEPSGLFAHNPEPLPEHLSDICELVKEKDCDVGIVTDPDADRLALVANEGKPLGEELTQVAAFDFMLNKKPGACATNLSSSRAAEDIAKKYNQICYRSAVGEINVVKRMQQTDAVIGGEGNGGVINPDLHYGRDSLAGTAMILQLLAERNLSLAEYKQTLPSYFMSKSKIELEGLNGDALLQKAEDIFADEEINTTDGVKIDFEDGWVHLRKSNTEPIIRLYSEGITPEKAEDLAEMVQRKVLI